MAHRISIFAALIALSFCVNVAYPDNINEIALNILKGSPQFTSEEYALESTSKNLATISNLPDPALGGEYLVLPKDVDNRWAAQLTWDVEWPGVYGARGKMANKKLESAQKALYEKRIDRFTEIKNLLIDFIQVRKKITLLDYLSASNDTIYHLAEQAAKGGELTLIDLNKVKLEYANIKGAKAVLIDEEAEIMASLSGIYGKDCSVVLKDLEIEFPPIHIPSDEIMETIKESAPAVKTAQAEAEVARLSQKVTKMEVLPSLSVGYKHAFEDGMHFNGAILGISIPIFSSRGKQKAAKADIMAAEYDTTAVALETEADAWANLKRLKQIAALIEEITPIVENVDYNAVLLKAYEAKVITLLDYITERNYFTNAAVELVTLQHTAARAQIGLWRYISPL